MQTITTPITPTEGIVVRSAAKAGGRFINHAEGIVVRSNVKAGGRFINHAEGVVVRSNVKAGRLSLNHSEEPVKPGPTTRPAENEGLVIEY
jgi:serine acetyltransferase